MINPAARTPAPGRIAFATGLGGALCLFALGLGMLFDRPSAQLVPPAEEAEIQGPRLPVGALTYMPLPDPIHATIRGGRRQLTLKLAFAVEGQRLDLLAMADMLRKDVPLLVLDLTEALRACDEAEPSIDAFRRALPEALRAVANGRYGTEDLPDPVFEVMIPHFVLY